MLLLTIGSNLTASTADSAPDYSIHKTHAYSVKITPHPELGRFKLEHNVLKESSNV